MRHRDGTRLWNGTLHLNFKIYLALRLDPVKAMFKNLTQAFTWRLWVQDKWAGATVQNFVYYSYRHITLKQVIS
jgi:hypothetical protein